MSDTPTAPAPRASVSRQLQAAVVRLSEFVLALTGLTYLLLSGETTASEVRYLALFDGVAVAYLVVGFIVVRRHRRRQADSVTLLSPRPWLNRLRRRSSFALTIIASLTGFFAATDVLVYPVGHEHESSIKALGVIAVVCAFTLLHVGYAKFYRNLDAGPDGPGLKFPRESQPVFVDYLYFSITLGVSFAVSDVEIIRRETRWHVLVHEIVSFFYNTGVLAIAVGVVTGR
jgi:uncharacterized membrane protein